MPSARKVAPIKQTLKPRPQYDCTKCPGYCCSYALIEVGKRDVARLARHFGLSEREARQRFTKYDHGTKVWVLRHQQDEHFTTICRFFDTEKRRCTIYEVRPTVCRAYPDTPRCGYYDFLKFEREQQGDPGFVATTG
jgi:Fe-S-cluster containining protein